MIKHVCPGGVNVARFPVISEVWGFDSRVRTLFSIDRSLITLCLPCYSSLLSACTVKRGAPSTV